MPLYEYQCEACGHRFEKIQKFSDPLVENCPKCGQNEVHKLVSSPAIQFKGTGWYITDYAKKSSAGEGKGGESKSGETSAEAKSADSKSADSKSADSKSAEGASGSQTKSGDSKTSDSKSSDSKPATTT